MNFNCVHNALKDPNFRSHVMATSAPKAERTTWPTLSTAHFLPLTRPETHMLSSSRGPRKFSLSHWEQSHELLQQSRHVLWGNPEYKISWSSTASCYSLRIGAPINMVWDSDKLLPSSPSWGRRVSISGLRISRKTNKPHIFIPRPNRHPILGICVTKHTWVRHHLHI